MCQGERQDDRREQLGLAPPWCPAMSAAGGPPRVDGHRPTAAAAPARRPARAAAVPRRLRRPPPTARVSRGAPPGRPRGEVGAGPQDRRRPAARRTWSSAVGMLTACRRGRHPGGSCTRTDVRDTSIRDGTTPDARRARREKDHTLPGRRRGPPARESLGSGARRRRPRPPSVPGRSAVLEPGRDAPRPVRRPGAADGERSAQVRAQAASTTARATGRASERGPTIATVPTVVRWDRRPDRLVVGPRTDGRRHQGRRVGGHLEDGRATRAGGGPRSEPKATRGPTNPASASSG